MRLPDLSNLVTVGEWRYIQSIHESGEFRNPDVLAKYFLPRSTRWLARWWLSAKTLDALRASRFYYYLIARTKYYDTVFLEGLAAECKHVIIIGCGTDTRAYRFSDSLALGGVSVLECDQPDTLPSKQLIASRHWPAAGVEYLALDLNDADWPRFETRLEDAIVGKTLVLMEGVTPYVDEPAVGRFLSLLARRLPSGSSVAYDFKLRGFDDSFGSGERTRTPFRLSSERDEAERYHESLGYELRHFELSDALTLRLIPPLAESGVELFREDALVRAELS
jgi:methyltransferase (TIGR00027 family)